MKSMLSSSQVKMTKNKQFVLIPRLSLSFLSIITIWFLSPVNLRHYIYRVRKSPQTIITIGVLKSMETSSFENRTRNFSV